MDRFKLSRKTILILVTLFTITFVITSSSASPTDENRINILYKRQDAPKVVDATPKGADPNDTTKDPAQIGDAPKNKQPKTKNPGNPKISTNSKLLNDSKTQTPPKSNNNNNNNNNQKSPKNPNKTLENTPKLPSELISKIQPNENEPKNQPQNINLGDTKTPNPPVDIPADGKSPKTPATPDGKTPDGKTPDGKTLDGKTPTTPDGGIIPPASPDGKNATTPTNSTTPGSKSPLSGTQPPATLPNSPPATLPNSPPATLPNSPPATLPNSPPTTPGGKTPEGKSPVGTPLPNPPSPNPPSPNSPSPPADNSDDSKPKPAQPPATPVPTTPAPQGAGKGYKLVTTSVSSTATIPGYKTQVSTTINGTPTVVVAEVPPKTTVVVKAVVTSVPAESLSDDGQSSGNVIRGFPGIVLSLTIGIINSFMLIA